MVVTASLVQKIGKAVRNLARKRGSSWHTPHMAAASRAVLERVPLVDLVLELRDARAPLSSEYELLRNFRHSSRHVIVLNKMDLASRSQMKLWRGYFEQQKSISCEVNSHNKDKIRELLNLLQARVRELKKADPAKHTFTIMLVGIPNVGKSALANSLHQIGRISATEKGKLKHATVSTMPGETKNISSLKIASHPNIYVLDTPGILPSKILNAEMCSKLALTGAFEDCLIGEEDLAKYFLAILYSSDEYKKWEKLSTAMSESISENNEKSLGNLDSDKRRRQFASDHTQDFIVHDVRRAIYETITSFRSDLENEKDFTELIEVQFSALRKAFQLNLESDTEVHCKVSAKLLNLYRTGRLGHYILDANPSIGNSYDQLELQEFCQISTQLPDWSAHGNLLLGNHRGGVKFR